MPFYQIKMRKKTATTFCIWTPMPWKNVVTGLRCSVTTFYRIICYMELWDESVICSYDLLPHNSSKL